MIYLTSKPCHLAVIQGDQTSSPIVGGHLTHNHPLKGSLWITIPEKVTTWITRSWFLFWGCQISHHPSLFLVPEFSGSDHLHRQAGKSSWPNKGKLKPSKLIGKDRSHESRISMDVWKNNYCLLVSFFCQFFGNTWTWKNFFVSITWIIVANGFTVYQNNRLYILWKLVKNRDQLLN